MDEEFYTQDINNDNEEDYLRAKQLIAAIRCLIMNRDKADMYENAAKIFQTLGNYKDSATLYTQCTEKAAKYKALAEKDERRDKKAAQTAAETPKKESRGTLRKIILTVIMLVIVAVAGCGIYCKTKPGRYARASFYENTGNYEKSYKMFGNLKTYKDSADRSLECRYQYASDCFQSEKYEAAKKAYRALEDYKDSEEQLALTEIEIIKKTKTGGNILFGGYHWLIAEKKEDKVLLVKSQPINGYAYNEESKAVTWKDCTLRTYLNGTFLQETFTASMTQYILDTEITVPDNDKYETSGGPSTTDKIFLLNAEQFHQYSDILSNYLRSFWLINPGNSQSAAQFASYGEVMEYGYDVADTTIHIRPALWISTRTED